MNLSTPAVIDSLTHPLAHWLRECLDASQGQIIIDDEEPILHACRAGIKLTHLFHTPDTPPGPALKRALPQNVTIRAINNRTAKKLFHTGKWSRVFAVAERPLVLTPDDVLAQPGDIVVLDRPTIAGNAGAIIRTAAALNAGSLVMLDAAFDTFDRRLIRASRGHLFSLPVISTTTTAWLKVQKRHGIPLVVTAQNAPEQLESLIRYPQRLAIAFGNEKKGCSPELQRAADLTVSIPTNQAVESLNISAAAAIVLFLRAGTAG
jgi:TrmH family RNA methyltransferase